MPPEEDQRAYWIHALRRREERGVSPELVAEALAKGYVRPCNIVGRTVYDPPAREASNGRGLRVVIDDATGAIVTVVDKGRNFRPRPPESGSTPRDTREA